MFLEVQGICKTYGTQDNAAQVLSDVGFSLERGELCVLLGPSGSGKSTLLNILGGIETADCGNIRVGDARIDDLSDRALTRYRRMNLGYVFQSYNLVANLNARENIETGAFLSASPLDINELLETLGLSKHQYKMPNQLSGGQQQRCAIGRAVVKNPSLLLCDEPTGALDYSSSKDTLCLLERMNLMFGCTTIIVTHNEAIAKMADLTLFLRDGHIVNRIKNECRTPAAEIEW